MTRMMTRMVMRMVMRMMMRMQGGLEGRVQEAGRYLTGCTHRLSNPIAFALADTDIY